MDRFAESMQATSAFFAEYVKQIANDGISLREIDDIDECLDAFKKVVQDERERIEAALEDAGGRDVQGDLNRAQKVKTTPEQDYVNGLEV